MDGAALRPPPPVSAAHRVLSHVNLLLPLQIIARGMVAWLGEPVADDSWRDAAVRWLDYDPTATDVSPLASPEATAKATRARETETAGRLAESYRRIGQYNEARAWRARADGGVEDPKYVEKLDREAARRVLAAARGVEALEEKLRLLEIIEKRYADSPAAKKAVKERTRALETPVLRLSRAELAELPDLVGPEALDLDPSWMGDGDGSVALSKKGVDFMRADGSAVRFHLIEKGETRVREWIYSGAQRQRVADILKERQRGAEGHERVERATRVSFPVELSGSAGLEDFDLLPRLLTIPQDPESLPLFGDPRRPRR